MAASRSTRAGMTIVESMVALVILSAAMIALVQFVGVATRQRRTTFQRLAAQMEVANEAERIAALDWDSAAANKLTTWTPSDSLTAAIVKPDCLIAVSDESGPPQGRRIRLSVSWANAAGQPVELTIWKFRAEDRP